MLFAPLSIKRNKILNIITKQEPNGIKNRSIALGHVSTICRNIGLIMI